MEFKLSQVGYGVFGLALFQFMGYLMAASPVSRYVFFLIAIAVIILLSLGLLNFAGLATKGYGFNRKTFTTALIPSFVLLVIMGSCVMMGVFLGVR